MEVCCISRRQSRHHFSLWRLFIPPYVRLGTSYRLDVPSDHRVGLKAVTYCLDNMGCQMVVLESGQLCFRFNALTRDGDSMTSAWHVHMKNCIRRWGHAAPLWKNWCQICSRRCKHFTLVHSTTWPVCILMKRIVLANTCKNILVNFLVVIPCMAWIFDIYRA